MNREILLSELAEYKNRIHYLFDGAIILNPKAVKRIQGFIFEIETKLQIINGVEKENWI